MAKALFITTKDIKRYSVLSGNVDPDKFIYMVEIAQDTEVQNYLGTKLLEKIQALIIAGTINDPANAAYTVANGGVYKHTSESSVTVDKDEVDYLVEKYRDIAQFYTNNFIDFMVYNQNTYPEYNANTQDDTYPDTSNADFGGWVL